MANTTWNPSDKTASVTLTGSNLIATCGGSNQGVRAAIYQTTGKFYFEVTMGWLVGNDLIGIATSAAALNSSSSLNTCVLSNSGAVILNNVATSVYFGPFSAGVVIGIAVDLVNHLIWFRVAPSGNWNFNAAYSPGGSGGVDFSAIGSTSVTPYAFFTSFTYAYTANFGGSAFSGAVPAGFTVGWPATAGPPPVELAGNLGGISHYGALKYGLGKYSQIPAFAPLFSADVTVTPALNLSGDLAPTIVLAADLDVHVNLIELAGGIAPQIDLGGALSLDLPLGVLEGGLTPIVVLGASSFVSGPLWATSEPCPLPPWEESEPCPPSMWTPIGPCDPVEWKKTVLCNG